jgi:dihydrolipoamide dehydrogenase
MKQMKVDVAVIGAGTAGMAAYRAARQAGKHVVLIEGAEFGTTCARVGCMPSKLLLAAANGLHDAKAQAPRGIEGTHALEANGEQVLAYVRSERDHFVKGVLKETDSFPPDTVIRGQARFESRNVLVVDTVADPVRIETTSVVIATGSASVIPEDFKLFGDRLITSDDVFDLKTLPKRCAVFGAGPIALELGQAFARLGVDVFLFGRKNKVGALTDTSVRDALIETLQQEFYFDPDATIHEKTILDGEPAIRFRSLDGDDRTERFDLVLVATGRKPALASLQLEKTGIELNDKGVPRFNEHSMQCGESNIFIAGDCDGTRALLADAADEGKLAGDNAARFPDIRASERKVPFSIVFCEPQVAIVGMSYDSLDKQMTVTGSASFETQGRSRVLRQNRGLLHVYAHAQTGRLLGAQACGPAVEHLGHLMAWALQLELTVEDMLKLPFYHPVVEEGLRTALKDANKKCCEARAQAAPELPSAPGC